MSYPESSRKVRILRGSDDEDDEDDDDVLTCHDQRKSEKMLMNFSDSQR